MSWLQSIKSLFSKPKERKDPWACLEISDIDKGMIKVSFDFNEAFVDKIRSMGFHAETAEDCVQLFFATAVLRPTELAGDPTVQSEAHPSLSSPQNVLRT